MSIDSDHVAAFVTGLLENVTDPRPWCGRAMMWRIACVARPGDVRQAQRHEEISAKHARTLRQFVTRAPAVFAILSGQDGTKFTYNRRQMRKREPTIELLRWMVEQYSPSHHEHAFARSLAERLGRRGWRARIDEVGNIIASLGEGPLCIALLGHIDTVPGEIAVRIDGGRLFGRGAVDAKGAICAFVEAVELLEERERAGKQFLLLGCVEEEVPLTRGAFHVSEHHRPDFVINGEPSGAHSITIGYKGILRVELESRVERRHTASNQYSAPAEHIVQSWNALRSHCDDWNRERSLFEQSIPSLATFLTGSSDLEEWAVANVTIRTGPASDCGQMLALLSRSPAHAKTVSRKDAVKTDGMDRLTWAFKQSIRARGARPKLRLKTGTSDWNTVAEKWQVPTIAYGPGDSALDHTPHEHVHLDEYEEAVAVLAHVLALLPSA